MKIILPIIAVIMLLGFLSLMFMFGSGISEHQRKPEGPRPPHPWEMPGYGEVKLDIFYKCLDKSQRQQKTHYNDSDELVGECRTAAGYLADDIMRTKFK